MPSSAKTPELTGSTGAIPGGRTPADQIYEIDSIPRTCILKIQTIRKNNLKQNGGEKKKTNKTNFLTDELEQYFKKKKFYHF